MSQDSRGSEFQGSWSLHEELCSVLTLLEKSETSQILPTEVEDSILKLEKLTKKISVRNTFSDNEELEEIPTNDLRFLLLPALLGFFTLKVRNEDRLELLKRTEIYFNDFLRRLSQLGFAETEDGRRSTDDGSEECDEGPAMSAVTRRELKIRRYVFLINRRIHSRQNRRFKERIQLRDKIAQLHTGSLEDSTKADEETRREVYLAELKYWQLQTVD
ncbi:unnamed protein product, partial [Soboliphyme baturini]|uniref:Uncharacterized protein n=1 Tax=Soboliphyme baturini TaxID=241478 RepID=A0A183IWH8_9BILA